MANSEARMKPVRRLIDTALEAGKIPPQATDMEQAVLGAILLNNGALGKVSDFLLPEHFYVKAHENTYRACLDLMASDTPANILTVTERMKRSGDLDVNGGPFYLSQLTNKVGQARDIEFHARVIVQKFMRRKLIQTCANSLRDAYDESLDEFDLMDAHNEGIASVNSITSTPDPITAADILNNIVENKEQQLYIHFGMPEIDQHVAMGPGCIVVIGARPGIGKTTMIMNGLMNMAKAGHKSLFLSLEMNDRQLGAKVGSINTGMDAERMSRGGDELTDNDRGRLALSNAEHGSWLPRIYIQDLSSLRQSQVAGIFERAAKRYGCKVVVIDYLQLMDGEGDNPVERMSNISKACKQAAKATGLRLIELSQLKRRDGADVNPEMSDLRESGQIEADGDIIMLLGREPASTELIVKVVKNKMGPLGTKRIPFDLMTQRIGSVPGFNSRSIPNPDNRIETDNAPF